MINPNQQRKHRAFQALHARDGTFVIPNPWNAGTAMILEQFGFEALATTSAGFAFNAGRQDSAEDLSREMVLENAREIVTATSLPVSADLEGGFGETPEACAETIRQPVPSAWSVARSRMRPAGQTTRSFRLNWQLTGSKRPWRRRRICRSC